MMLLPLALAMTASYKQNDQTGSPCSSHDSHDCRDCCADYVPTLGGTHKASFGLWAHYIKLKGSSSTWASRYYAGDLLYQSALLLMTT